MASKLRRRFTAARRWSQLSRNGRRVGWLTLLTVVLASILPEVDGVGGQTRFPSSRAMRSEQAYALSEGAGDLSASRILKDATGTSEALLEILPSGKTAARRTNSSDQRGRSLLAMKPTHGPDRDEHSTSGPSSDSGTTNQVADDYGVDVSNFTKNFTSHWGDQKSNVMGLPSYAAVLVGGTAAALIVICTNWAGGRLSHPLPFFATDEQKLKDKIEQAKEKVRILEQAVKDKRAEEIQKAEEEARRLAGEQEPPSGPSHDELVGEMLYRTQEVQKGAVGAVNESIKQAAPLLARASHVQNVFKESVAGVQERVGGLAIKEATTIYGRMKEAIGVENDFPDMTHMASNMTGYDLPNWFKLDDENDLDPPPFALLLGGMFAPAQIKMTRGHCQTQIVWNSLVLATCTACSVIDHNHACPDKLVWIWQYGMFTLNGLDVICCSYIASKCASAIGTLSDDEDRVARIRKTGNSVWDLYISLQANSGQFFKAYFAYQGIIDSWLYSSQKFLSFLSLFWGILGVWITCEDVVEDTLACDAKVILWWMHTYSWFFLLFLTWTLLALILWLLQKLSTFTFVTAPIMVQAKESDEEVPFKLPLFQTLARSFLLRDSSTMLHIKAKQVQDEVASLEKETEEAKLKLSHRKYYLDQLEARRVAAQKHEKALVETYKEKVRAEGGTLPGEAPPGEEGTGSGAASSSGVGASSSTPFFGGASAADLLRQAEGAAAAAQQQGLQATLAQSSAAASSAASSAFAGAQAMADAHGITEGATNALASAQQLADEHGITQGASDAFARAQQLSEEHGVAQGAADALERTRLVADQHGINAQGASEALTRAQQMADEHGVTQAAADATARAQEMAGEQGLTQGSGGTPPDEQALRQAAEAPATTQAAQPPAVLSEVASAPSEAAVVPEAAAQAAEPPQATQPVLADAQQTTAVATPETDPSLAGADNSEGGAPGSSSSSSSQVAPKAQAKAKAEPDIADDGESF